jgi:hypothetical protein
MVETAMSRRAKKMQSTRGTSNPVIDSLKAYQLEVTKSYIVSTTNRRPTLPSGELEKKPWPWLYTTRPPNQNRWLVALVPQRDFDSTGNNDANNYVMLTK